MGNIPNGWVPKGLQPIVKIYDWNDVLQYTYEHSDVKCSFPITAIDLNKRVFDLLSNNHGTWTGSETYTNGKVNKAGRFTGTNYVTLANESVFDREINQPFSMSCLVYVDELTTSRGILSKGNYLSPHFALIYNTVGDCFTFFIRTDNPAEWFVSTSTIQSKKWYHVIVTYDGSSNRSGMKIYVDGVLAASDTSQTISGSMVNNEPFAIGYNGFLLAKFLGNIQQVKYYDYELTAAQCADEAASENPFGTVSRTTPATKEFGLMNWDLSGGIQTDFGQCTLMIHDHDNQLTDLTSSRREALIKNEYRMEVWLGKNPGSVKKWFEGRIREGSITRLPKQQYLQIFSTGMGTLLSDRHTKISFHQKKDDSNPGTGDPTDSDAKASEIFKRIRTNPENYILPSLPIIPFTVYGVEDIDVKITNFDKRPTTPITTAFNELVNMSGSMWGIDYSIMDLWMRFPSSISSGLLITNDLSGNLAQNWNPRKLGILLSRARTYTDSTIGFATPYLFGPGALHPIVDIDQTSSDATLDLSSNYHVAAFTPGQENVWIIAPFLVRNGTPTKELVVSLIGSDINGDPDVTNVVQKRVISKEQLQALSASGEYFQIEFDRVFVSPKTKLFIYFEKYADATNHIDLDYQTGSGEYWTSGDGTTWNDPQIGGVGKLTGDVKMRVYAAKKIQVNYFNTALAKAYGNTNYPKELTIPVNDLHEDLVREMFIAVSTVRARQARFYEPIVIYPPESLVDLGKTARYIDRFNGLNITADIISYQMGAGIDQINGNGAVTMTVEIKETLSA